MVQRKKIKSEKAGKSIMLCQSLEEVREKAELYGANQDMVEALYREMIARFICMEMKEFQGKNEK